MQAAVSIAVPGAVSCDQDMFLCYAKPLRALVYTEYFMCQVIFESCFRHSGNVKVFQNAVIHIGKLFFRRTGQCLRAVRIQLDIHGSRYFFRPFRIQNQVAAPAVCDFRNGMLIAAVGIPAGKGMPFPLGRAQLQRKALFIIDIRVQVMVFPQIQIVDNVINRNGTVCIVFLI